MPLYVASRFGIKFLNAIPLPAYTSCIGNFLGVFTNIDASADTGYNNKALKHMNSLY